MLIRITLFLSSLLLGGCAVLQSIPGFKANGTQYQNGDFSYGVYYRGSTNRIGQGFLRTYNGKCRFLTALHVFENDIPSEATNRKGETIALDLAKSGDISFIYKNIDVRVFDIEDVVENCPQQDGADFNPDINDELKLAAVLNSGDLRLIPSRWHELPSNKISQPEYKVRVQAASDDLKVGYSGGVLLSSSGVALGMLQKIDNGIGIVQPMQEIDKSIQNTIVADEGSDSFCARNRLVCVGGGALLLGGLVALASEASGGSPESSSARPVTITSPLP